jgi:putative glycerol-1-phosphate prenyltransferase
LYFSGNPSQISDKADAILFCPYLWSQSDYLIGIKLMLLNTKKTQLEVISTGYMLIESGPTAVELVSPNLVLGEKLCCSYSTSRKMLGNKLIYLEAGSGRTLPSL